MKDAFESVGVCTFDGGAVVPPESDHVYELGVFIEKHCQMRRILPVTGVDEGLRDVLGGFEGYVHLNIDHTLSYTIIRITSITCYLIFCLLYHSFISFLN